MPDGLLVTAPRPVPVLRVTVSAYWLRLKLAVIAPSWPTVTVQVPVPLQAPLQPVKLEPVSGVAVSVTTLL